MLRMLEKERQELSRALEYQQLLTEATTELYEFNHELDMTHNCMASNVTREFLEKMGMEGDTPYDAALIALKQRLKKEFQQGFMETFGREQVLAAFANGILSLTYEFPFAGGDRKPYVWMRIHARMFHWKADDSVRMITCWQNIDEEKKYERGLLERAQRDPLTGLYNKKAARERSGEWLERPLEEGRRYVFFILDIDNFKSVNDTFGHAFGDQVIMVFAALIRRQFRETDVVGRIGGDEFVVFAASIRDVEWAHKKAGQLVETLNREVLIDKVGCQVSASIGVSICPDDGRDFETLFKNADTALYVTKKKGKNGYTFYESQMEESVVL